MKACPFRLVGVKGEIGAEASGASGSTPLSAVQCLGEQCTFFREYSTGPGKTVSDCTFVAAATDAMHLRDQIGAIAQVLRASAPRR